MHKNVKNHSQTVMESRRKLYDMIQLSVPKGEREKIKAHAESKGESMNEFIRRAIAQTIDCDSRTN